MRKTGSASAAWQVCVCVWLCMGRTPGSCLLLRLWSGAPTVGAEGSASPTTRPLIKPHLLLRATVGLHAGSSDPVARVMESMLRQIEASELRLLAVSAKAQEKAAREAARAQEREMKRREKERWGAESGGVWGLEVGWGGAVRSFQRTPCFLRTRNTLPLGSFSTMMHW
jgi:hypothetical protein